MKTREEVEALKANWRSDPCWDLEDTEGFEEYREELAKYQKTAQEEWEAKRKADIEAKQKRWFSLKINERFWPLCDTCVMRVPNGWFVTTYQGNESSAFIPYSDSEAEA